MPRSTFGRPPADGRPCALNDAEIPDIAGLRPRLADDFALRLELFFSALLDNYLDGRDTIRIVYRELEQLVPHGVDRVVGRLTQVNAVIATFVRQAVEAGFARSVSTSHAHVA